MKTTTVLFDLDGTLLPMDNDVFEKAYFKLLVKKLMPLGYDPDLLVGAVWKGVMSMVTNDGSCTNKEAFWKTFAAIMGEKVYKDEKTIDDFYINEFNLAKEYCGFNEKAAKTVRKLKEKYRVALATNPIFPAAATENRISWAGLDPSDFELYTTYENIGFCKPNPEYYKEILKRMDVTPQECVMVGNDVTEDMIAETLGMKVFLLKDCIINKKDKDISFYPQGSFDELMEFLG